MKQSTLLRSKALSPYAQALKQIALKGSVALGPSAKEMELEMYRAGTLPADYKPPVQGKWDDTIERWAYAWQFPAEEESEDVVALVEKNQNAMQSLLEFTDRLASTPPSSTPRSGVQSQLYSVTSGTTDPTALLPPSSSSVSPGQSSSATQYDALEASLEAIEPSVMPVEQFSAETNIPIAYMDDQSERSNASKELSLILDCAGLDYTEDGLIVAITALSRQHYSREARALFDFAANVGLGPNAEMYKALMKHASSVGDANQAMAVIEEMKESGVTPRIGNWHELMRTFHRAKDYSAVSQIVDNMKMYANIEPSEVTFALQLRALSKDASQLNSLAEAVQLFDQMENVYGYIASRPHYDALMFALSQSPLPEMRLRCEELARKMDLMGITWTSSTYLNLIRSAQVVGDVGAVEIYLSKMREERLPVTMMHLSWAVQAHVQRLIRANYEDMKEKGDSILTHLLTSLNTCFGIYELVVQRGWEMQIPFVNALLRLCCQTTILSMEHIPDETNHVGQFEEQANKVWNDTFDEWHLKKDTYSYECYIALLAHQQRVSEAEKCFQEMILQEDLVPTRRTYECLIFMHLSSGEEGGAARALHYLEAMEKSGITVRPALLKKIVRVHNAAGYKRDMKRRARRIMQAREEYMARKEEGLGFSGPLASHPVNSDTLATSPEEAETHRVDSEGNPLPTALPIPVNSTLAWWEDWKKRSLNKHELFESENDDGTPRGELFAEKNEALAKMGIESAFKSLQDVPTPSKQKLLPAIRAKEGEMAGSLWALDGGELSYPKDGGGPEGWGVRLWRERALVKKEFQKSLDGNAPPPAFSQLGKSVRVGGDQLDIERSGATTHGELADYREYSHHVYEDGTLKPASEMAHAVPPSGEFIWQAEKQDALSPYKTDQELALQSDNTFYEQLENDVDTKTKAVVEALRHKNENDVSITGRGTTRRSKLDYLEKWRDMYRHGTLEVPDVPPVQFGRSPDDHRHTVAASVRDWYRRNQKSPAVDEQLERWQTEANRSQEERASKQALKSAERRKRHDGR